MTVTQLRAFLLSATLGSFTAAAAALGSAQPTISELVRKLELTCGLQLFIRAGRRLVLTAAGNELLPWARRVVEDVEGAEESLNAIRGLRGGVASVGVLRNASYYFLSDLAVKFHSERPGVHTRLVGQNSVEVANAVRSGELEAGFVVLPIDDDGLSITPLRSDEVLWVSADPSRCSAPMTIENINNAPLILYDAHYGWNDPTRRQLADRAQAAGVKLEPLLEVENVEAALALVARGMGDTLASRAVIESAFFPSDLHTVAFDEPLHDIIALVTRENAVLSPATAELVRMASEMLEDKAQPVE